MSVPTGTGSKTTRVLGGLCLLGVAVLAFLGLVATEPDVVQGEAVRILYVHVPVIVAGYLGIVVATVGSIAYLWKRSSWWDLVAASAAEVSTLFIGLTLVIGALWGKPTWGTYWVWDARLTSELILLFLYFGFMGLKASIEDERRADRAGAVLALVGVVNVPIIYFSVQWWNTLHQGASVSLTRAPSMAATMLAGMLVMALAFWLYSIAAAMVRVRCLILERAR